MILTLTLNRAVDQTVTADGVVIGDLNRVRDAHLDPAGKGINVSRAAHRLGWPTAAFGLLGGELGGRLTVPDECVVLDRNGHHALTERYRLLRYSPRSRFC